MAALTAPVAFGLLLLAGCYPVATPPPQKAKLKVLAEPAHTRVYVASRFVGSARVLALRPKALAPGMHYLSFEAPDHFPHDLRVKLVPGTTTIRIKLRPIPP